MIQGGLYEESAISERGKSERRMYMVFHVAGIVMLVIAGLGLFLSISYVPNMVQTAPDGVSLAFSLVIWFAGILVFGLGGFVFWRIKRRFNVSYDYTFVEDELRITKVFNGRKRKFLYTLKSDQILKIGYCENESFERTRAGFRDKKPQVLTPNDEPAEGKKFVYILYTSSIGKSLYIIECRDLMLEYLVRAAGRNKFERL